MSARPYLNWPPGLHRVAKDRWIDVDGEQITDEAVLGRLAALAIPPAWKHVWVAPDPKARLQARGIDSRGRVQYRYSDAAVRAAAADKFHHMVDFAGTLPDLRSEVAHQLRRRPKLPDAEQITALVVRFLDLGLFRIGTQKYAHENQTYGLTTLECQHVQVTGNKVTFDFVGKEHLRQKHAVEDATAARLTQKLLDAHSNKTGAPIFQTAGRNAQQIDSESVNSYIQSISGSNASAKVFRTWGATVIATSVAAGATFSPGKKHRDPALVAYDAAAHVLGNTPTMARDSYVHPRFMEIGATEEIRRAVESTCTATGSREAHHIFTDVDLQSAIHTALEQDDSKGSGSG